MLALSLVDDMFAIGCVFTLYLSHSYSGSIGDILLLSSVDSNL